MLQAMSFSSIDNHCIHLQSHSLFHPPGQATFAPRKHDEARMKVCWVEIRMKKGRLFYLLKYLQVPGLRKREKLQNQASEAMHLVTE